MLMSREKKVNCLDPEPTHCKSSYLFNPTQEGYEDEYFHLIFK